MSAASTSFSPAKLANGNYANGSAISESNSQRVQIIDDEKRFTYVQQSFITSRLAQIVMVVLGRS